MKSVVYLINAARGRDAVGCCDRSPVKKGHTEVWLNAKGYALLLSAMNVQWVI